MSPRIGKRRENRKKNFFEDIMVENFPNVCTTSLYKRLRKIHLD